VGLPKWGKDFDKGWTAGYDWRFFGGHNYAYKVPPTMGTDLFWKTTAWQGLTITLANLAGLFVLDWKTALWALGSSIGFNEAWTWGFEKVKVAGINWIRGKPEYREQAEAVIKGMGFTPSTFGTTRFHSGSSGVYSFLAGWLLYVSRYTGQWGSINFAFGSKLWFPQGVTAFPFLVSALVVSQIVYMWVLSLGGGGGGKIDHPTHLINLFVGSLLGWWFLPKKIAPIFHLPGWLSWTLGGLFIFLFTFGQEMYNDFLRTYLIGDDYVREPEMTHQEIMELVY
jgi:hypothetical protein